MKKLMFSGASLLALWCCGSPLWAGFVLGPHRTVFTGVTVGHKVQAGKFGASFRIINDSPDAQTYTATIRKPSQAGRALLFGYEEIPDPTFIVPEQDITVAANSTQDIALWMNIPAEEKYYNRKWEAEIEVTQKGGSMGIQLEGQLWLETEAKAETGSLGTSAGGGFVLAPAILDFKGFKGKASAEIYNLSKTPLTFLIVSKSTPEKLKDMFIPYSAGYDRLEDSEWVTPSVKGEDKVKRISNGVEIAPQKKITLKPGEHKTINIELNAPMKKEYAGKKESFIFVRCPELDVTRFIRIRFNID
jgi:hypothetical protein